MLDLIVIHPGAVHGLYGDLGADLIAVEPPLWTRLIAGYVRDHGFSVEIIDQEATGLTARAVASWVEGRNPRLVCIAAYGHQPSASTQQMVGAGAVAREIKKLSQTPIIMVGGHVAALPERTLREEAIDYACNGEGPVTVAWLLDQTNQGRSFDACPGLVWKKWNDWDDTLTDEYTAHSNPPAPLIPVDQLHGDVWHLLPMTAYRAHNWQCFGDLGARTPYASIYTTLGCPYRCSFCCINAPFASANKGGNSYRMRSAASVVRELIQLWRDHGVKTIKIVDEMFVLNERHYTAICTDIIDAIASGDLSPDLNIWAYARVDTVKPHTLEMFRKAGIRWLALGIESGSKHVRDGADKALKNDDIVSTVRAIEAAGIHVISNFIFGLADDTAESCAATLGLALELRTAFANFYSCMAYPGSSLYTQALATGATLPATWSGYSQHNADCRPLDTEHLSARDVLAFRDKAFTTYFTDPAYHVMVREKFGPETLAHVEAMTTYKLHRKLLAGEIA